MILEDTNFNYKGKELIDFISENEESGECIIDLRPNNGSEECLQDWFKLANKYIGIMDTVCDDRGNSSQEITTQWILIRHFTLFDCTGKKLHYE